MKPSQPPPEQLSTSIRVRFTPGEKRALEAEADRVGVTMAHALREGIRLYLGTQPVGMLTELEAA